MTEIIESLKSIIQIYGIGFPAVLLMAITCSAFGVFVVLKRIVFIGVTLSEVAACGVALALVVGIHPFLGAAIACLIVVSILSYPFEFSRIPRDAVLGNIFILASGMSILLVSKSGFGLEKVKSILYGNLLFASNIDIAIIAAVLIPAIVFLWFFFRPILYLFLDRETAQITGISIKSYELLFFFFLGLIVAASSKIAGVMLVFCYLVIPASAALLLSKKIKNVFIISALIAVACTIIGIYFSFEGDLPPNQMVAVTSCLFFVISLIYSFLDNKFGKKIAIAVSMLMIFSSIGIASNILIIDSQTTKQGHTDVISSAKPDKKIPLITDTEKLLELIKTSPSQGIKSSLKYLETNPPLFFRQEIIQGINKALKTDCGWNTEEDFKSENNQKALEKISDSLIELFADRD